MGPCPVPPVPPCPVGITPVLRGTPVGPCPVCPCLIPFLERPLMY